MDGVHPSVVRRLAPCPFCGAGARLRRHPEFADIVRVECGGERCAIRPGTEYLLVEFGAELVEAWNGRARGPGAAPGAPARRSAAG